MAGNPDVIKWLLEGDPVIRWQTLRDLCDAPEDEWEAERRSTLDTGWGAAFLERMQPDGSWPKGRWTDTVWTLPVLIDCGLPAEHSPLRDSAQRFIDTHLTPERAVDETWLRTRMDLCHLGFWLRIGGYFLGDDPRLRSLAATVLRMQFPDGGWNCRKRGYPKTHHSSFHTTFNVLEGLRAVAERGVLDAETFRVSEARALECMLMHRMYRSDHTGKVIDERFTHLTFPSHWHYTVLRGLDYMGHSPEITDPRLDDPIDALLKRRNSRGRWPVEKRIPGIEHFDMEPMGGESRWNTLRALRVLRAHGV